MYISVAKLDRTKVGRTRTNALRTVDWEADVVYCSCDGIGSGISTVPIEQTNFADSQADD